MRNYYLLVAFIGLFSISNAQVFNDNYSETESFIPNKGQFDKRDWGKFESIEYAYTHNPFYIFFSEEGLTYRFDKLIKNPNYKKGDPNSPPKRTNISELVFAEWIGSNENVEIISEIPTSFHYSYAIKDFRTGNVSNKSGIKGFKKITYKNLYDNIDVEYTIHKNGGVKYNIILYPGANPSDIQLKYSSNHTNVQHERVDISINNFGALAINTSLGAIVEHNPVTFYTSNGEKIKSQYEFTNNVLKFKLDDYDNSKSVTIDPWIVSPTFNTSTAVWEVETDGAGNVYTIGGETPMELWKYNAAGALQWQYVSPWDTSTVWLGTLATNDAGVSFITSGTVPEIERIDVNGNMVWHNNGPGGIFGTDEFWSITFNCDDTRLIVGGTGGTAFNFKSMIYEIDMSNGNTINSVEVGAAAQGGFTPVEVRSISSAVNGKYVFLTHQQVGTINDNFGFCPNGDVPDYEVSNQEVLGYKCETYLPATQNGGGLKALIANDLYFYTHAGDQIRQWDLATGALLNTAAIPGGSANTIPFLGGTEVDCSGLDVDDCGNVYAGSMDRVVKFDPNLNILSSSPTTFNVYDISVNSNGEVIACGAQQDNQATNRNGRIESLNMSACAQFTLVCCDANICLPNDFCVTDPVSALTATTGGGTFSGNGVDAAGNFDPAVAGPGTHLITYTLPCGSGSVNITVNPCAALDVCEETNGNLTASGGTGPYTWYEGVITPVSTSIGSEQECIDCPSATPQYDPFFGFYTGCSQSTCSYTDTIWTQFGTGTTVAAPSAYPIYVIDANGDSTLISQQADLIACAGGCTFTVSAALDQAPSTCGAADGSIIVCGLTASTTYDNLSYNDGSGVISLGSITADGSGCYTISNLAAGSYTDFSVTLGACTETDPGPVTLSDPGGPTITGITVVDPTCPGACDGSLTAIVTGGTAPYTYQWYDGLGNPIGTNSATISGLCADNYSVEVTDAGGGGGTTQLFYDDFESGAAGWTLNVTTGAEGVDANFFVVNDNEGGVAPPGCGVALNGDATLHITSVFNPSGGAAYDAGGLCGFLFCPQTNRQSETPFINTVGQTNLTLNFDFIANGAPPNDQATVWYNDGSGWTQLGGTLSSGTAGCAPQGTWTAYSQALPASCENIANLQIAIRWQNNDDGAGTDPSVAINNLEVTATSSGGNCTVTSAATLTDPTGLTLSASLVSDPTSCGSADGVIEVCGMTASTTYTDLSYDDGSGTVALGSITSDGTGCYQITGLTADSYSNFVLTDGTCTYSTAGPVALTDPTAVTITASLVSDPTTCGAADGVIQVCGMAASTSYGDLSYDDPVSGTVSLGGITSDGSGCYQITGLAAGAYTNFVLTDGSCISTDAGPVTLTDPSSVTITAAMVSNPTACGAADGVIEVCGMSASTSYTDLSYDDPIAGTVSLGAITSDGTGCFQISGLAAGSYTNFTLTDGACVSTDAGPVALTDPGSPTPTATLGSDPTVCGGTDGTINICGLTASTLYDDISYNDGVGTISLGSVTTDGSGCYQITGLPAGNYFSFTVTLAGCTGSDAGLISLTDPAAITITASVVSDPTTCSGTDGVIQVCGMAASTAYSDLSYDDPVSGTVSLGAINSDASGCYLITGLPAGAYTNFVLTDGACTSTDAGPITLSDPSAITITASVVSDPTTCGGTDGVIQVCGMAASTAYSDLSYDDPVSGTVSLGAITSDASGCYQITGLPAGAYTNFVLTDGACTSTDAGPVTLSDPAAITIIASVVSDPTTCGGTDGVIQVCGMAASTAYTDLSYDDPVSGTVSLGAITSDASGCYQITGLAAGAYTNFVLTDGACTSIDAGPVTLTDPGSFTITASVVSDPTACATSDGVLQICGLTASTTYDDLSYDGPSGTVSLGSITSDASGCYQITTLAAGSYSNFVVTQGTCTGTDSGPLTLNAAGGPTVTVTASANVSCNGAADGSATVSATGGTTPYTYSWSPSGGTGPTANNLTAGTYTVTVTDNTGCTGTQTVTITEPTPIVITETIVDENCGAGDGSISIAATGGGASFYTYSWAPGGQTTSSITGLSVGNYTVTVTGNNGCSETATYSVSQIGSLNVVATPSVTTINSGESIVLAATGATDYTWTPSAGLSCDDCPNPTATPSTTTTYIVTGTDPSGCTGSDTVLIVVELVCGDVFVPNIFSPNGVGDPENNQLCVYGNCIRELRFRIFNRWGQLVFETEDPTLGECWDGTFKGQDMMTGTYVYTLYVETFDNEVIEKSGNITLVK